MTLTFITDDMKRAIEKAKAAAGDKHVMIQTILMSLLVISWSGGIPVPPPQINEVNWQGKAENNLNFQSFLFYSQIGQSKLFGSERTFTDPFHRNDTDGFTPMVTAIDSTSQTVTLTVVVNLPSWGSYTLTVPGVVNNTALYLSIPDPNGALKKSSIPFCYVWWDQGAVRSDSFVGVIDYTVPDQIKWLERT